MIRVFIICGNFLFLIVLGNCLESNTIMRIGQNGGLGPLSVGMDSHPIGAVRITGGAQADIFAEIHIKWWE